VSQIAADPAAQERLAIGKLVGGAYREVFSRPLRFAKVLALPLGLALALGMLGLFLVESDPRTELPLHLASFLPYILLSILWHRRLLLDLGAAAPGASVTLRCLGVTLGYAALVGALVLLPLLLIVAAYYGALFGISPFSDVYWIPWAVFSLPGVIVVILACLALGYPASRLSLVFPATALGQRCSLRQSWRLTAGQSRPLYGAAVAASVSVTAATGLMIVLLFRLEAAIGFLPSEGTSDQTHWIVWTVIASVWSVLQLGGFAVIITVFSLAYSELTGLGQTARKDILERFE